MLPLIVGAIGVVYGDIGTSPLYTIREVFSETRGLPLTEANVYGLLSLVFWALIVVVTVKYLGIVMRADNNGEGGQMALTALVARGLRAQQSAALVVGGLWYFRRLNVLWRCDDHAGDLGALRGRGAQGDHARARRLCGSRSPS